MNGLLNLYKPSGISSAKILNSVKKELRGIAVGHMGTLDPLASGVLPVAIGKSTRLFDYLLDKEKIYEATFAFGYMTDSLDLEGNIVERSEKIPSEEEIESALADFSGEVMQVPPAFSAKFVDGKRSYKLARKGEAVQLPPKKVVINYVRKLCKISDNEYKFEISCKGGTYIRAIARDLGRSCGSCATMTSLVRKKSGIFEIENSVSAEEFIRADDKEKFLIKPEDAVDFPKLVLTDRESERLYNGLYDTFQVEDGVYRVFTPDKFYGIGAVADGKIKIKAYLKDD